MTNVRIKELGKRQIKSQLLSVKKQASEKPSPTCFYTWEDYFSRENVSSRRRTRRSIDPR